MNNITVKVELSAEDRTRLDNILTELKSLVTGGPVQELDLTATLAAALPAEEHPIDAPVTHFETPAEPVPTEPTPAPAEEVKPVSLAEFQKAVTLVCAKGTEQKKAAKAVINKYAPSVSAVPEDKRAEVMAELAKL